MAEYVIMPKADYEAACDSIRAKTGKTDSIKSGDMSAEIASITGGGGGSAEGCVTVTFMNGNTELFSRPVYIGDDCPDPIAQGRFDTPTKESTAQYNYVFYGWGASDGGAADGNILKNITEDKTVYAVYTATAKLYTITFYDDDGTTVLTTKQVPYGTVPSYTPTKDGLVFYAWTPSPVPVTGDASYTASWTTALYSGTFDTGLVWAVTTDGTYRISGNGAMPDYESGTTASQINPAFKHRNDINNVVIDDGVTHIGNYTFAHGYATGIKSVRIGSGVKSIGKSAFYKCTSLTNIVIPSNVTSIGADAVSFCSNLTDVTLSDGLLSIGEAAFLNCSKLTSISIPDSVTTIYNRAFVNCKVLPSLTIPSGVTSIGKNIIGNCTNLLSVTFKNTSGWYVTETEGATSGTDVDVTDPSKAATQLKTTYKSYYWYRS